MKAIYEGTVYKYLQVICLDKSGKTYNILCSDYDESIDEIKVRTDIKNDELQRGWMGNLSYITLNAKDVVTGKDVDKEVEGSYMDVLLKSVNIWTMTDGEITWEYTFLKK